MKPTVLFSIAVVLTGVFFANLGFSQGEGYSLRGKLTAEDSGDPLPFVQVALFKPGESRPVSFSDSDDNGNFSISAPGGEYLLRFFLIGYDEKELEINLNGNKNLETVTLISENQDLEEVVVQSSKFPIRSDAEGLTINPSQNLSNLGGTLLDILRNTPSVSVSEDGAITLRGSSGTNVLINGRNSSLTQNLDQIPASAIEQIKIINNPNARYDAEAEAGVIDIVLKKGENLGTHGNAELTYGTRGRANTGININHRTLRYNVFAGYNFRRWRSIGERRTEREIFEDEETLTQNTNSTDENIGHNLNFGADYYFGDNIISYEGFFQTSDDSQVNTLFSELRQNETNDLVLDYVRRNRETEADDGFDNALIYERTFDNKDKSFKVVASNSYRNQYKIQNIDIYRNTLDPTPENLNGMERAFTDEKRYVSIIQADYISPLSSDAKIEAGIKSNIRKFDNDYIYTRFQENIQDFVVDPNVSNRFIYKDQIHAAYMIYSNSTPKFDYTVGLRGEYTFVDTFLENTGEANQQEYVNLFPSLQTLYKIDEENSLKLSYSRRIDRPTAWRLNPFPDITDSLSVRRGNSNLQPELIHSLEFGHLANFENSSLTTNLFYRHVDGQLDFVTLVEDGISYSQPANLNTSESYGVEFIGITDITPWWNVNGSFTAFQIRVDGSNVGEEFVNQGFAWNTKLMNSFTLPMGFSFQLVGNYESAEIEAQGRDLAQYYIDANVQKSFWENKGALSLSIRDIFDTRRFAGNALTNTFRQSFYAKRETRIVMISAKYRF
ncbi:Outer membrane receptor proteins, mostly Fe transport [Cyclobacterium lianum]|uniref:Outer membrane receptor proteins, mostly Fe transport n=1 Tax=Cyclobacterium lianum TaxID=388280 RepID=A0A1M7Q9W3_9BACT|nr:outer membrane beta-barrel family protein [Cyclobacterium lianum]SHN27366.1 Outer membrane receptor proteins, mostly Fe transport [Cyclobacterium lianum]